MVTYVHKKSDIGWKTSNGFKGDNVFRKEKEKPDIQKQTLCFQSNYTTQKGA
mgnify:CR=1 FL=1